MTTFDDREQGLDGKFAREEAIEVKALALRSRLLGLWAGGVMGLEDPHLENYANAIIRYEDSHPGGEAILRKLAQDLLGAGLKISEDQVRGKMDELLAVARGQIQNEA